MTGTLEAGRRRRSSQKARAPRRWLTRLLRITGWLLITTGVVILLYLVYLLFYTSVETEQAQQEMLEEWQLEFGDPADAVPGETPVDDPVEGPAEGPAEGPVEDPVTPGSAYAVMWFERPGSDERPVRRDPIYLVEGVSLDVLRRGPGHYPGSAAPGQQGNFAVSGHRTTYGAPFYHLDQLQPGDEIHVVDRQHRHWVYVVARSQVVQPTAMWVVGPDPLGNGQPTLTLTTCEPKFSAARRLIVFAQLRTGGA